MKPTAPVTKRVKKMERRLDDASTIYDEVLNVAPHLQYNQEGQSIVEHTLQSSVLLFR